MIKVENLTKKFGNFTALDSVSCSIPEGCILGLVGSNGAGKSTFIRVLSGIYKPEGGSVTVDGAPVFENPDVKCRFVTVPDGLYFFPQANIEKMAELYAAVYENFSFERFRKLLEAFGLEAKKSISEFSKGMKRQAVTILALSTMPEFIFLDETFDGLDPVRRKQVKSILYSDVCERKTTVVVASHSLRELEDTCDRLVMLHKGKIVLENDAQSLKSSFFNVQIAFDGEYDKDRFTGLDVLSFVRRGRVANLILRGDREETVAKLRAMEPLVLDVLPLSFEEVFQYEMDTLGYTGEDIIG